MRQLQDSFTYTYNVDINIIYIYHKYHFKSLNIYIHYLYIQLKFDFPTTLIFCFLYEKRITFLLFFSRVKIASPLERAEHDFVLLQSFLVMFTRGTYHRKLGWDDPELQNSIQGNFAVVNQLQN